MLRSTKWSCRTSRALGCRGTKYRCGRSIARPAARSNRDRAWISGKTDGICLMVTQTLSWASISPLRFAVSVLLAFRSHFWCCRCYRVVVNHAPRRPESLAAGPRPTCAAPSGAKRNFRRWLDRALSALEARTRTHAQTSETGS